MPKKLETDENVILNDFRKKKVMTLIQITAILCCCQRTAKRRIKKWQALSSYNYNGRYYTLPGIPRFDEAGLWSYRDIRFSKRGNLRQTVVYHINQSEAGYSARELEGLLGLKRDYCLTYFRHIKQLNMEKLGGRYIYFS